MIGSGDESDVGLGEPFVRREARHAAASSRGAVIAVKGRASVARAFRAGCPMIAAQFKPSGVDADFDRAGRGISSAATALHAGFTGIGPSWGGVANWTGEAGAGSCARLNAGRRPTMRAGRRSTARFPGDAGSETPRVDEPGGGRSNRALDGHRRVPEVDPPSWLVRGRWCTGPGPIGLNGGAATLAGTHPCLKFVLAATNGWR